ncbi:hypothetical protein RMATCC62417_17774 [Rhizopus microsporus]|nr:hypothetical protein RMATCC62417_17774 [Rhizopus microsporus]
MSNELQLLENVELKLALSTTDAQLEKNIQLFLPPVLLKLASTDAAVKQKVMTILSHVNKRVKTNNNIKLPFDALLAQFTNSQVSTFVKNFTLIYLEMSASRQSPEEIVNRLPELLRGISQRPVQQRIQLLHVILPILRKWNMDPAEQTMAREQQFQFNTSDVSVILGFFLDVMLYQPLTARDLQEGNLKQPGLSKQAMEDVTNKGKVEWTMTKLKDAKLGIVHFVLTPIFTDSERLPLLIAGACDSNQQVASTCEDEREENWKTLQRKVSGTSVVTITSGETTVAEEFYDYSFPPRQDDDDDIEEEEEGEETMSDDIADVENNEEHHDVLHPDMQQFDIQQQQQFQQFRRKSIIPVDETVYNELSRHVSLEEVLNQTPGAGSSATNSPTQ